MKLILLQWWNLWWRLPGMIWRTISWRKNHDDVIKWKHFRRNWPFVRGIHRSPVTSPHKGQWRGALMLSLICAWVNDWVNNREAGDYRRKRVHYDVIVMCYDVVSAVVCQSRYDWFLWMTYLSTFYTCVINSMRSSDAYVHRWIMSTSVSITAFHLMAPILTCYQSDPWKQTSVNIRSLITCI